MLRKSVTLSLQEEVDIIKAKKGFAISLSNPSFNPRDLDSVDLKKFNLQGLLSGENKLKEIAKNKLFNNWKINNSKSKNEVLIANGAKAALYCIYRALSTKNRNFGVINPNWPTYDDLIKLSGAKPFYFNTVLSENFDINLDKLKSFIIKNKIGVLTISSPNNPCGKIYTKEIVDQLISICSSNNCYLVIDESFSALTFKKEFKNIVRNFNYKYVIIVNSFSKNFHLQGLRLGAILAKKNLIDLFTNIHIAINGAPNNISQYLISKFSSKLLYTANLNEKKNIVTSFLKSKNIEFYDPDGSFYLFPKIKNKAKFIKLSKNNGLFYLPGESFGSNIYKNHYRFCFEKKLIELNKIIKIMEKNEIY